MIKGTDQTFKFKIPYDCSDVSMLKIIFWQEDYNGISKARPLPIIKEIEQCSLCDCEIYVTLTPEETLRFTEDKKAYVQLIAKLSNGESFGTQKTIFTVYPVFNNEAIEDIILPTPSIDEYIILSGGSIGSE